MENPNPRYPLLATEDQWRKLVTDATAAMEDAFAQRGLNLTTRQLHFHRLLMWQLLSDLLIGETK